MADWRELSIGNLQNSGLAVPKEAYAKKHFGAPTSPVPFSGEDWFDPLEEAVHFRILGFVEALVEEELKALPMGRGAVRASQRPSRPAAVGDVRHGNGVVSPCPSVCRERRRDGMEK